MPAAAPLPRRSTSSAAPSAASPASPASSTSTPPATDAGPTAAPEAAARRTGAAYCRYSPQPRAAYLLEGTRACEMRTIGTLPWPAATWNLMWLSHPGLDQLPGAGAHWWKVYPVRTGLLGAIVKDLFADPALRAQLLRHPTGFIEWFEQADHSTRHCAATLDGADWTHTVLARAAQAEARLLGQRPPLRVHRGQLMWG